jgi:S1-C subfamily serine protease
VGVVHLSVSTTVTTPAPPPPDEDGEDGEAGGQEPEASRPTTTEVDRRASGFVVARSGDDSFIVTTFGLLVDPRDPSVPIDAGVTVRTAAGETTGRVHSWDARADLLLLRVPLRGIEPLPWRPADQALTDGERIVAIGLTPSLGPVRVGGTVAAADDAGLVTDIPPLELLGGGPIVDAEGRVVAVGSARLSPFGTDPVAVPIRRLCGDLLARCPD